MISERLKKVRPLSKRDNSVGDVVVAIVWDRDKTEKESTVCIDWRVIIGVSDNIGTGAEVDTFFLTKV